MSNNQLTPIQKQFMAISQELQKNVFAGLAPKQQERFMQIAVERFREQPELIQCSQTSVISAFRELALSEVEPTKSHAIFVPRENKKPDGSKVKECVIQWTAEGKKRAINVATKGEYYVLADVVRRNDKYIVGGFPRQVREHEPAPLGQERGDIVGAYAVLMRQSDEKQMMFVEMTVEDIEHIRDTYSDTQVNKKWDTGEKKYIKTVKTEAQKADTVWHKEFSEMCIKTIIGRLHKRLKANINTYIQPNQDDLTVDRSDSQVKPEDIGEIIDTVVSVNASPNITNTGEDTPVIDIEENAEINVVELEKNIA